MFCSGTGAVGPLMRSEHLTDAQFAGDKSVESMDPQIDHLASRVYLGVT